MLSHLMRLFYAHIACPISRWGSGRDESICSASNETHIASEKIYRFSICDNKSILIFCETIEVILHPDNLIRPWLPTARGNDRSEENCPKVSFTGKYLYYEAVGSRQAVIRE